MSKNTSIQPETSLAEHECRFAAAPLRRLHTAAPVFRHPYSGKRQSGTWPNAIYEPGLVVVTLIAKVPASTNGLGPLIPSNATTSTST